MTNKPMLSVERELLERIAKPIKLLSDKPFRTKAILELRALLDKSAKEDYLTSSSENYFQEDYSYSGYTPEMISVANKEALRKIERCRKLLDDMAAQPQGEAERLRKRVKEFEEDEPEWSAKQQKLGDENEALRSQLAERDALLQEMRDLATAIPVLMLAVPNPHDVASRDKHIESVNTLIERCDAALSTSAEPKPRGGAIDNPVIGYADSYRAMARQGVETVSIWSVITDLERNIAPLYTEHPAPVAVVLPERMKVEPFSTIDRGSKTFKSGYNAAILETAKLNGLNPDKHLTVRRAFVCKGCEGVYADEAVSRCDCMCKPEFIEGEIIYQVAPFESIATKIPK